MATVFDGELEVTYGYVLLGPAQITSSDLRAARAGQVNGICGAAQRGVLSMVTGLHSGPVPLVIEVLGEAPVVGPEWEDVVEVSFGTEVTDLHLQSFDDWVDLPPLPAIGTYRARYSARGMDAANDKVRFVGAPTIDQYLLQLWPALMAPDVILRETSAAAGYWHERARATSPARAPDPAVTAEGPEEKRRRLQQAALLRARLSSERTFE